MTTVKTWQIEVHIEEEGDETQAVASLKGRTEGQVRGVGRAKRNPDDPQVPRIGDELAAARALSELVHHLLEIAARDIEQATGDSTRFQDR